MKKGRTLTSRFRAALEFRNAKSMAHWSIRARLVASGRRSKSAVSIWEGAWGSSESVGASDVDGSPVVSVVGEVEGRGGGVPGFGVFIVGVRVLG